MKKYCYFFLIIICFLFSGCSFLSKADIETDSGNEYDILVYTYTVNEDKPERVGVYLISVYTRDENDELILGAEIGELLDKF